MSLNLTSDSLWWHVSMEELWGICSTICHMKLSPDLTNWKKGIVNSISTTCKFLWNWHTNCTTILKQWLGRDRFALDQFHIAWCFRHLLEKAESSWFFRNCCYCQIGWSKSNRSTCCWCISDRKLGSSIVWKDRGMSSTLAVASWTLCDMNHEILVHIGNLVAYQEFLC